MSCDGLEVEAEDDGFGGGGSGGCHVMDWRWRQKMMDLEVVGQEDVM